MHTSFPIHALHIPTLHARLMVQNWWHSDRGYSLACVYCCSVWAEHIHRYAYTHKNTNTINIMYTQICTIIHDYTLRELIKGAAFNYSIISTQITGLHWPPCSKVQATTADTACSKHMICAGYNFTHSVKRGMPPRVRISCLATLWLTLALIHKSGVGG